MKLADVYLHGPHSGRTVAYVTAPGTRIQFVGGHAAVHDEASLRWALRRPECVVVPVPRYRELVARWHAADRPHQAAGARLWLGEAPAATDEEDAPPAEEEAAHARLRRR